MYIKHKFLSKYFELKDALYFSHCNWNFKTKDRQTHLFLKFNSKNKIATCSMFCKIPVPLTLFSLTLVFYLTRKQIFTNVAPKADESCYWPTVAFTASAPPLSPARDMFWLT